MKLNMSNFTQPPKKERTEKTVKPKYRDYSTYDDTSDEDPSFEEPMVEQSDDEVVPTEREHLYRQSIRRKHKGIEWRIIGKRRVRKQARPGDPSWLRESSYEYLIHLKSATPDPADPGSAPFVCALVGEQDIPFSEDIDTQLSQLIEIKNLSHPFLPGLYVSNIDKILALAWKSGTKDLLGPNQQWDIYTREPWRIKQTSSEFYTLLDGIFGMVAWRDGRITYESGHTLSELLTPIHLLNEWNKSVCKAQGRWRRIQLTAGERPVHQKITYGPFHFEDQAVASEEDICNKLSQLKPDTRYQKGPHQKSVFPILFKEVME